MKITLLVTTFNWPNALDVVMESIAIQVRPPDEVIIADDGSALATLDIISKWRKKLNVKHVWLPDNGFRAARARNLAVLKSRGDYIIMIDGDCPLPPNFVKNHWLLAEKGMLVSGGRCMWDSELTQKILLRENIDVLRKAFSSLKFLPLSLGPFRYIGLMNWRKARTCNLAVWKSDVFEIEGFDESYLGWGYEDSDFVIRLLNNGAGIKSGRFYVCVGHLEHKEASRSGLRINAGRLDSTSGAGELIVRPAKSVMVDI